MALVNPFGYDYIKYPIQRHPNLGQSIGPSQWNVRFIGFFLELSRSRSGLFNPIDSTT